MNVNQFVNMLTRMVTNRLLNWGMRRATAPKPGTPRSPQQKSRDKTIREAAKRARQAARITRRMR